METTGGHLPNGILHPAKGETNYTLTRYPPSPETGFLVKMQELKAEQIAGTYRAGKPNPMDKRRYSR